MALPGVPITSLDGEFIRLERRGDGHVYWPHEDLIANAHGLIFACPRCVERQGRVAHRIVVWSVDGGVPAHQPPMMRRKFHGTGLEDITVGAGREGGPATVYVDGGCNWFGFVEHGHVVERRALGGAHHHVLPGA